LQGKSGEPDYLHMFLRAAGDGGPYRSRIEMPRKFHLNQDEDEG